MERTSMAPTQLKYFGREDEFNFNDYRAFISIGSNSIRNSIFKNLKSKSSFVNAIHPSAIVAGSLSSNSGIMIGANVVVNPVAKIAEGCIINTGAVIEHECNISAFVHIAPGAVLAGNVSVGIRTFIGANTVVKEGITIGTDVTIGAGSTIIDNVPNGVTVVGNPGRIIRRK